MTVRTWERGRKNTNSGGETTVVLTDHGIVGRLALSTSPFGL
ncbi:hypothetical protein A2U01_0112067, partial [Trifolium medium]|nr:hypothetical protein [Trifolium medium]